MITKEQLATIDYTYSEDGYKFSVAGEWEYQFNVKTQELWNINDGVGEPEFICKITDFEKLKDLLDNLPH